MRQEVIPTFHLPGAIKKQTMDQKGVFEKKITTLSTTNQQTITTHPPTRNLTISTTMNP
jgi:hypothetical protein